MGWVGVCVCVYVDGDAESENQSVGMVWIFSGPSHKRSQVGLVMSSSVIYT